MKSIDAEIEIVAFDRSLPIVLLNEIPLVPSWKTYGGDYSWHDCTHTIISLEFDLKPMDRLSIIYRDPDHLPTERINIAFSRYVISDTEFNVRTLEIVKEDS